MSFLINTYILRKVNKYEGVEFPRELIYLLVQNRIRLAHERIMSS